MRPPEISEVEKYFNPIIDTRKVKGVNHIVFLSVQGVDKSKIPAGNSKFTLIDVRDIGSVSACILTNTSEHINKSYELTCKEKLSFPEMTKILRDILKTDIEYKSPNLINFFLAKRKEKIPTMLILVMIMLHYFPRFRKEPEITDWVEKIANKQPITFVQFVTDNKKLLTE